VAVSGEHRAYVNPSGGLVEGRWQAHVEVSDFRVGMVDSLDDGTFEEAMAWARERADWVLIVAGDEPLAWTGTGPKPEGTVLWDGTTPVLDGWWTETH